MDRLWNGLGVTAVGLIVVFFGLFILVMLIKAMQVCFTKAQKPAPTAPAAPAPAPAPVAVEPVEEIAVSDDSEIVAAIMAALSCVYEGTGKRPVVRAVRRSSSNWKHAYR